MKRATNIQQNVKTTEMFGGSDIFATLSLIAQTRAYTLIKLAGAHVVNIRLFMQKCMGSLFVFYPGEGG